MVMWLTHCRQCAAPFMTENPKRMYCSTRCRRAYQDERRKRERAEATQAREREKQFRIPVARAICPIRYAIGDEPCDCSCCMECFRGENKDP